MERFKYIFVILFFYNISSIKAANIEWEKPVIESLPFEMQITGFNDSVFWVNGERHTSIIRNGKMVLKLALPSGKRMVSIKAESGYSKTVSIHSMPLWLSVVPPLLAILLALFFKEVLSSLLVGIASGAMLLGYYTEGFWGVTGGILSTFDTYILQAIVPEPNGESIDRGHISVIVFSMLIGGLVTLISRNGGMEGVVNKVSRWAKTPKSGQLVTWFLGIFIFFDDYANTLVVGNTMRPVTDKLKISREKLSYLVDSTAAPVAAISLVSTWIGAELGYIEKGIEGLSLGQNGVYGIFINSLKYSFYPVFTLLFMLLLILKNRDFGAMYQAEKRARSTDVDWVINKNTVGKEATFLPDDGISKNKRRPWNALLPVIIVVFGTILSLLHTGTNGQIWHDPSIAISKGISEILGNADSFVALLWSSSLALLVAVFLTLSQKLMGLEKTVHAVSDGFRAMLPAVLILILAWALSHITEAMHTADFMKSLVDGNMSPSWLPVVIFVVSALISFSTGSSWSTMAILYPTIIPVVWGVCSRTGLNHSDAMEILYHSVSVILAGSVLGDHCSPISDTTILSSLASGCDHLSHVKTQFPYALTVGVVSLFAGIASALGVAWYLNFIFGIVLLYFIVAKFGKEVKAQE